MAPRSHHLIPPHLKYIKSTLVDNYITHLPQKYINPFVKEAAPVKESGCTSVSHLVQMLQNCDLSVSVSACCKMKEGGSPVENLSILNLKFKDFFTCCFSCGDTSPQCFLITIHQPSSVTREWANTITLLMWKSSCAFKLKEGFYFEKASCLQWKEKGGPPWTALTLSGFKKCASNPYFLL